MRYLFKIELVNGTFIDSIVATIAVTVTNQAGKFDRTTKIVLIIKNKKKPDYKYFAILIKILASNNTHSLSYVYWKIHF